MLETVVVVAGPVDAAAAVGAAVADNDGDTWDRVFELAVTCEHRPSYYCCDSILHSPPV